MDNTFITFVTVFGIVLPLVDLYLGCKAFRKKDESGIYLGICAILAAVISASYLASVLITQYRLMSLFSSVYFAGIDWLLVCLAHFVLLFTDMKDGELSRKTRKVIRGIASADTAVLLVNVFYEWAVHYENRGTPIAAYEYEMKPLYIVHLLFDYALVLIILGILIYKVIKTPAQYQNQFSFIILAILFVVAVNAIFLYVPADSIYSLLDYSILGYSIGLFLMYWSCFDYRVNNMMESLSMTVFENMGQGIVLFDYMDKLIMHNKKSEQLLTQVTFREKMPMSEFIELCELPKEKLQNSDSYSIQSYSEVGDQGAPLRCDYRKLIDRKNHIIGKLFAFSDASRDNDLLTGFRRWESFTVFAEEHPNVFDDTMAVASFDINGLGEVNRINGRDVGDQRIRRLAQIMREEMPPLTHFVRGFEAHLIAICYNLTEPEMRDCAQRIMKRFGSDIQFGLSTTEGGRSILEAINTAGRSLQVKKLLDDHSSRSQSLTSLVRALRESDTDTEEHVRRTQKMGALLGERIGLSDSQQSDLSLLCLLHDIGKIGIPLEILNKPDKLSDEEWKLLRSHPEKGYQIAMSSNELKGIAEMILRHHERWDGKGYPGGLKGEEIPILSRVIAIVDAYDAMVNNRSYKRAYAIEKAKDEIRRCAGTQFDPKLCEMFLAMLEENPEIAKGTYVDERQSSEPLPGFNGDIPPINIGATYLVNYSRYVLNSDSFIVEADDAFERITGYTREDLREKGIRQIDLIPREELTDYLFKVDDQLGHGPIVYLEHNIKRKDGRPLHVFCYGKRYYDSAVKSFRTEVAIFDISSTHFIKDLMGDLNE